MTSNYLARQVFTILFAAALGATLTHAWRAFIRRRRWIEREGGIPVGRLALGVLALSATEIVTVFLVLSVVAPMSDSSARDWFRYVMPVTSVTWFTIYLVWTILYVAFVSRRHVRRMEMEKLELQLHVKEAELRALQAQVNPHFFFNSLNSIRALIFQDPDAAADVIDRLASMMRYTLQSGATPTVLLEQEMDAVRDYLAIEQVRFEERLKFRESIAPDLARVRLPAMCLQTLVENAVKYGLETSSKPCVIEVEAYREGQFVRLTVSNTGKLQVRPGATRVGLKNAERRLALVFGHEAGLELREQDDCVVATVSIPLERAA